MSGKNTFNFDINPGNIIPSDFGNTTRDNYLKFQLENEVGASLGYVKDGNFAKISLISKTGKTLSTIRFKVGSGEGGPSLTSVTLDETNKRLVFTLSDETKLYCDLTPLYTTLNNKVDKVEGKGLSSNDYTTAEKTKLAGIETGAQVNTVNSVNGKTGTVVLKTSDLENDSHYVNETQLATKQDKLTAGQNITISSDNVISATGSLPEGTEDTQALIFNGTEWIKQAGYGYQKCDYTEIYWNGTTTGKTVVEVPDFGTVVCKVDNNQYLPSKSELLGNKFNYKDSEGTQEDIWTEDNLVSTEDYIISNTSPAYTLIIVYSASAEVSYYGQGITLTKGIWYSKQNDFTYFSNLKYGPINVKINSDFIPSDDTKVDKIEGKGLSTNDYTNADKTKLSGIESGAQVNKIEHIKVNGVEQTIVDKTVDLTISGGEVLDTNVKLSSQLKTYYNIGKIQTASGTNPVVIGEEGDTLRQVLNNLTQMDEIQPTVTSQPSITGLTFSSTASDEIGTVINQVSYSLSTNEGSYTYGPNPTGVSWSSFNFSGGCEEIIKSAKTGTLTLSEPFTVGSTSSVSFICEGIHTEGNIAKTNLGNNSNPVVKISSGSKTKSGTFKKTATTYAYTCVTNSATAPVTGCTKKSSVSAFAVNGDKFSYNKGDYIYFYTIGTGKTVQTNVLGQWADVNTTYVGKVTITQSNGAEHTFDCYRIGAFIQSGSDDIYRI